MIVTVASFKGGVGKTTTAVHLAAYLNTLRSTALLDGDSTRNAIAWEARGGFPFPTAPIEHLGKLARVHEHLVIDTGQRPSVDDLQAAAEGSDLLVIPAVPSPLDTDGLGQTIRALRDKNIANFRVLLTRVPPDATRQADELRELLTRIHAPVFRTQIPRLKAFEKAAAAGCTAAEVDDRQALRAWQAYEQVGQEMTR